MFQIGWKSDHKQLRKSYELESIHISVTVIQNMYTGSGLITLTDWWLLIQMDVWPNAGENPPINCWKNLAGTFYPQTYTFHPLSRSETISLKSTRFPKDQNNTLITNLILQIHTHTQHTYILHWNNNQKQYKLSAQHYIKCILKFMLQ